MAETNDSQIPFRKQTLEKRKQKYSDLCETYPGRIPVVFEIDPRSKTLKDINLRITFSPKMTFAKISEHFRKSTKLEPSQTIFFYCGKKPVTIPPVTLLEEAYSKYKEEDGFLYIRCCDFEAMGSRE